MAHALREQTHDDAARSSIADDLVNPASGIANDYLNLFNEIVMLIEQLPTMPELIDDIKAWKPTSYEDYFIHSPLPGRESAIEAYQRAATRGLPVHRVEYRQPAGRTAPAALETMRALAGELFPAWQERFALVTGRGDAGGAGHGQRT